MPRTPLVIGDPSRRISVGGALVVIGLVVTLLVAVRFGFDWVVAQSDDWSLASARRVVETSSLPAETQAGLAAELDRLDAAFGAGTIDYDGLFATLQRVVEGTLIPVALLDSAAAAPDVPPTDAAGWSRLARSLQTQDFVPEHLEPVVDGLRAGVSPAKLGAELAEGLEAEFPAEESDSEARGKVEAQPPPAPRAEAPAVGPASAPFDVVAKFRAIVDATLAGHPPYRYAPR
jgi:hypothetical protein